MRLSVSLSASALLFAALTARADVIYDYTGHDFTTATGTYNMGDLVTGSFTLANPITADTGTSSFTPLSFTFSDGVQTIDSASATYANFVQFDPDGTGGFTQFSVTVYDGSNYINLENLGTEVYDTVQYNASIGRVGEAGSFAIPGSTVTPEPSSFALLGTGLLGLAGFAKKRFV